MQEITQQLCQTLYHIDILNVMSITPIFYELLIPTGNGHFCTITDELRKGC